VVGRATVGGHGTDVRARLLW